MLGLVGFCLFVSLFFLDRHISCFFVIFEEMGNTFMVYKAASKITITANENNFPKLKFSLLLGKYNLTK